MVGVVRWNRISLSVVGDFLFLNSTSLVVVDFYFYSVWPFIRAISDLFLESFERKKNRSIDCGLKWSECGECVTRRIKIRTNCATRNSSAETRFPIGLYSSSTSNSSLQCVCWRAQSNQPKSVSASTRDQEPWL